MLKVVGFEGGPCGGKTTAIDYVADNALCHDINTVIIPEVAGQMIGELQSRSRTFAEVKANQKEHLKFQTELLNTIADSIKSYRKSCSDDQNMLVLVDRVDNAAYVSRQEYWQICETLAYREPPMHTLVDTVLYFPTLAKQNPHLYSELATENPARYESPLDAIRTCDENYATVRSHPDVWVMEEESFERSLRYAANIALRGFIGYNPYPVLVS